MTSEKDPGTNKPTSHRSDESELPSNDESKEQREVSFARRALIKAGWVAPIVLSVSTPAHAQASPHTDSHGDEHGDFPYFDHADGAAHTDTAHVDGHTDF